MNKKVYLIKMRQVTYSGDKDRLEKKKDSILADLKDTPNTWRDPVVSVSLSVKKAQRELKALLADGNYVWTNNEAKAKSQGLRTTYWLTVRDYYIETRYAL